MTIEILLIECSFAIPVALPNTNNTNNFVAITLSRHFVLHYIVTCRLYRSYDSIVTYFIVNGDAFCHHF